MSVADTKPEPIRVGVEGFVAFDAKTQMPAAIPWGRVLGLPAFQMFMAERHGVTNMASFKPQPELFDEYCQWHSEKGYWPDEDPLGNLASNASLIADEGRAS